MKAEEFNKYADWITKNNYKPILEFIPPEFWEDLFLIMQDFAEQYHEEKMKEMRKPHDDWYRKYYEDIKQKQR